MIMTTIATVLLSLYFGSPVAFIGLTGGFATPLVMYNQLDSSILILAYLYSVSAVFLFLIKKNNSWLLSIPLISLSIIWAKYVHYVNEGSDIAVALYLSAIAATLVFVQKTPSVAKKTINLLLFPK